VAGTGEDGVDAVAILAEQVIPVEAAVAFHVADDGFDGAGSPEAAAQGAVGRFLA